MRKLNWLNKIIEMTSSIVLLLFFSCQALKKAESSPAKYKSCLKVSNLVYQCTMNGWDKRSFDLYLPNDSGGALGTIIALHGGGSNKDKAPAMTCKDGDLNSDSCLIKYANSRGFAVVFPNGSGRMLTPNIRTFNAGGGDSVWACVSGYACENDVNDLDYFSDLFLELQRMRISKNKKFFLTGASNGAAMTHKIACELSDQIAGIAPVAGANQYETLSKCDSSVPILAIHGTDDKCWPFNGGTQGCVLGEKRLYVSMQESMNNWRIRNGCGSTKSSSALPDTDPADGTTSVLYTYKNCIKPTKYIKVNSGGHKWPGGSDFGNGTLAKDFSASKVIVDFFLSLK